MVLGGMTIDYDRGLLGHTDADVLVHAVIDSLLGAAAMRDIGTHFPDNDARYKDMSSIALLKEVNGKLAKAGYQIGNIDATVVCERPRLSDHISDMVGNLSDVLGIDSTQVSVKASTCNGVGSLGKGDGIAAYAVALINRKE